MSLAIYSPAESQRADLFGGYQPLPGVYDETYSAPGALRPHWRQFVELMNAMGPAELGRRWEQAQRLIRENGVTYNVHGDSQGKDRPWELDAMPLLVPAAEWNTLAAGLAQRARLLNLVLADVYGPQALVAAGHLPPELVFAHPGFLRPCHRIQVPHQTYLHLYAAHLARSADTGDWLVLSDQAGRLPAAARVRRRKSDRDLADAADEVSRLPRAAIGFVLHVGPRDAARLGCPSSR